MSSPDTHPRASGRSVKTAGASLLAVGLLLALAACSGDPRARTITCSEFTAMTTASMVASDDQERILATLLRANGFDDSEVNLVMAHSQVWMACQSASGSTKIADLKQVWR